MVDALVDTSADEPRPLALGDLSPEAAQKWGHNPVADLTPAAVLVPVVRRAGTTPAVVLNVRSQDLRNHAGQISFPGGRRDSSDSGPVSNALREASEEMGLNPRRASVLGFLDDYPTISGFRVTPVVAFVDADAQLCPDGREVAELFEVPLQHLVDPANYERRELARDGIRVAYYAVPYKDRYIWGATAGMLHELALRYCGAL